MTDPAAPSPFSTRFDARISRRWRPLWLGFKWSFAGLGAYLLVGVYVEKWGWPATIWFLGAPFGYGVWRGIEQLRASGSPPAAPPDSR